MSIGRFAWLLCLVALLSIGPFRSRADEEPPGVKPPLPPPPPPLKLDDPPPAPPTFPPVEPNKPTAPASPLPLTPPSTLPNLTPPPGTTPPAPPTAPQAAPATPATAPATITVQVPASATLWFGEQRMNQTGPTRTFRSPPLDATKNYMYKVRVSWPTAPGQKDYTSEHEITVKGGQTTIIDFTGLVRGPATTGQPPVGAVPQPQPQPPSRFSIPNIFRPTSGSRP
jgi:uncharacterized protein (TIGR03000 family)